MYLDLNCWSLDKSESTVMASQILRDIKEGIYIYIHI